MQSLYKRFQNHLVSESYSNATISKIISQFRQFLRWAKKNGFVSDVYIDYRTSLNTNYKPIIIIEESEIKKLYFFSKFDFKQIKQKNNEQPSYIEYFKDCLNSNIEKHIESCNFEKRLNNCNIKQIKDFKTSEFYFTLEDWKLLSKQSHLYLFILLPEINYCHYFNRHILYNNLNRLIIK